MKHLVPVLVAGALLPLAAMAAEQSPREHCFEKVADRERQVLNAVARAGGDRSQRVTFRVPSYYVSGMDFRNGTYGTSDLMGSLTINIPSERTVMATELRVLDWHKGQCVRLPDSGSLALHTRVTRGGGVRKLKHVQP